MFTNRTRASPSSSARAQIRFVCTSTPMTPETTSSVPSTTRSAEIVSPWKLGSPGVSMTLILRPCHSRWQSDAEMVICRRCSSSSQSATVEPCSIVPSRLTAPDWKSIASTSEVFPVPRCPVTATLRIFPGSTAAMRAGPPRSGSTRDLIVARRPVELRLERRDRALDLPRPRPDRARDPIQRAELVDDRALDASDRVRLELDVAVGVVPLDRADQSEQAIRDEILLLDMRGKTAPESPGDVLHERCVSQDQAVA